MKVLLVQDHLLFGDCLNAALGTQCSVSTVADIDDALNMLDGSRTVDLVILDLATSREQGLVMLSRLESGGLVPDVLVLGSESDTDAALRARRAGARGYLATTCDRNDIRDALLFIRNGKEYWPDSEGNYPSPELVSSNLSAAVQITPRQRQVLVCLEQGMSNREIARKLDIKEVTVKSHVSALLRIFLVDSRYHCVARAREAGLL